MPLIPGTRSRVHPGAVFLGAFVTILAASLTWNWWVSRPVEVTQRWQVAAADARGIAMAVMYGACDEFERFDVHETTDSVSIAVIYRDMSPGGCAVPLLAECRTVALAAPLGSRRLIQMPPRTPDPANETLVDGFLRTAATACAQSADWTSRGAG